MNELSILKTKAMKLNELQRSRLKVALIGSGVLLIILSFPVYIINEAANRYVFDVSAPWIAFGTIVTSISAILGYYLNRETARPSLLTNNTFIQPVKKILDGEDFSDPEDIPL